MTGRKVVQISTAPDGSTFHPSVMLTALCDDGSMHFIRAGDAAWKPLPSIPQDKQPADAEFTDERIERAIRAFYADTCRMSDEARMRAALRAAGARP